MDSEIDRKLAALVPDRPPRPRPRARQAALPRGAPAHRRRRRDRGPLGDGVEDDGQAGRRGLARPGRARSSACCPSCSPRRACSTRPTSRPTTRRLLLGVNEKELAPVGLDVEAEPHLLIFGDGQSGKSAALRSYVHEVMRTRTPKQAQLVVVDYRRSLLGEVPDEYLLNYLTSAAQATPTLADLASLPGEPHPRPAT